MNTTALYYFFSTVAQVMAAISALLAIFTQFKITEIKDYLLGVGKAIFERIKNNEEGHTSNTVQNQLNNIRDSVDRKSILGIRKVISALPDLENNWSMSILYPKSKIKGIYSISEKFDFYIEKLKSIKENTRISFILSFIVIIISLFSIIFTELMINYCLILYTIVFITLFLVIISFYYTIKGIKAGLMDIEEL